MNKNTQALSPGYFYHIYNRGINKEKIFLKEENYFYFLRKYDKYLSGLAETYVYCLLPNHFHLLVKIRDRDSIFLKDDKKIPSLKEMESLCDLSEQFRKFFISYSMSINKQEQRMGSLS